MHKAQRLGMQCLTRTKLETVAHELAVFAEVSTLQYLIAAIDIVIEQDVSDVFHMHPDLVCTACLKITLYQRDIAQTFEHTIMGNGIFTNTLIGRHTHLQPVTRVACNVTDYSAAFILWITPHNRIIGAFCSLLEELHSQMSLCIGCLCHNKQTRGVLVNTVHKANLWIVGVKCRVVLQMPRNSIDECSVRVATAGMHHKTGRFVYYHEVIVLIYHVKGYILGHDGVVVCRCVVSDYNLIEWLYLIVALDNLAVDRNGAGIGSLLYLVARCVGNVVDQELVNAHRRLTPIGRYTQFTKKRLLGLELINIKQIVGYIGELDPAIALSLGLDKKVYLGELDLNALTLDDGIRYKNLPKFPAVKRDLALIADEKLTCAEVEDVLLHSCKYVTEAKLFDVYRGGQVPEGKKSMAFTLTFTPDNNVEKAFTPETLDGYVKKILNNLKFKLGIELR